MRARVACSVLFALLGAGCSDGCGDPPPSISSGCWAHPGGVTSDDPTCVGSSEGEPNGDLVIASSVGTGACFEQTLSGAVSSDIDVFSLGGKLCAGHDALTSTLNTDQDDVRLCMFVACSHGKTGLSACSGAASIAAGQPPTANHLPEGALGCCRLGQGTLNVKVNCDEQYAPFGAQPSWRAYFVVDRVRDNQCTPYTVAYQF